MSHERRAQRQQGCVVVPLRTGSRAADQPEPRESRGPLRWGAPYHNVIRLNHQGPQSLKESGPCRAMQGEHNCRATQHRPQEPL